MNTTQPKQNGGARIGAGRKKLPYELYKVAVHTNELVLADIEEYRGERSRSKYIAEAIEEKLMRDKKLRRKQERQERKDYESRERALRFKYLS